jgi:two-component system response regulator DesR
VIRILLAEDMHMVRGALVALLELEPDIEVVAEVSSGDQILAAAKAHAVDVAVIDIDLPGTDGLTAAGELHEQLPRCRTLILTGLNRPSTIRRALTAKVGGFMLKDAPAGRLADAVRTIAAGGRVVDAEFALAAWDTTECPLTDREVEVLKMAAAGADPTEIATRLFLSAGTVRNYLTTIVAKLQARNRIDAIRVARDSGWI